MTPERWRRIEAVFHDALARSGNGRAAYLDAACEGDPDLRGEVEAMLAANVEASGALRAAVGDAAAASMGAGQVLGSYRLVREIGAGGMGSVWLAERADGTFDARVAIKILKLGTDTAEMQARFRQERQILARLRHPNITAVLDGGVTPEGRPYVVMEYVEGQRIDQYAAAHALPLRERLNLFLGVCNAVEYSHRNLVVHRDLKPGNILVTPEGTVKLLDFGIAKILEPDDPEATVTSPAGRMMTPDYACPETILGESVTTVSDVYSLGVVLFVLLTGQRPYGLTGASIAEISSAVTSTDLAATGAGEDIDNIVQMATRKEPARRYQSVEALAEDIRRYLTGRPVIARPASFGYRAARFVQRNRAVVAAGMLAVASMVGFSVWALLERNTAQREQRKAERVASLLVDVFRVSDPTESRGEKVSARDILARATEQVRTSLKGEPEVQAMLLDELGQIYSNLDDGESAEPLLRQSAELLTEGPARGKVLNHLGMAVFARRRYDDALKLFEQADRELRQGGPSALWMSTVNNQAITLLRLGRTAESVGYFERAIEIGTSVGAENMTSEKNNLALALLETGDTDRAIHIHREVLAYRQKTLPAGHPDIATALANLSLGLEQTNQKEEAETHLRQALEIDLKVFGPESSIVTLRKSVLGALLTDMGRIGEAEPLLRETVRIRTASMPGSQGLGITSMALARLLCRSERPAEGLKMWQQADGLFARNLPPDHWRVLMSRVQHAECLLAAGDAKAAEVEAQAGLAGLTLKYKETDYRIADTRALLARIAAGN